MSPPHVLTDSRSVAFLPMRATVARVQQLSRTFRRITLTGPQLHTVADNRQDQRFKMLFPAADSGVSAMPLTVDWYEQWRQLPDAQRPPMRTYTLREVRPDRAEFDVDIALHGRRGPASSWAMDAVAGDEIVVCVPHTGFAGGFHGGVDWRPPQGVERLLIVADETALPAVAGIFESMAAEVRGIAVVEVPHGDDIALVSQIPAGIELRLFPRGSQPVGTCLIPEVRRAAAELGFGGAAPQPLQDINVDVELLWDVPTDGAGNPLAEWSSCYAWMAGEASVLKELRRHLVQQLGVDRRAVACMGYWRQGRAEA